MSLSQKLLCLAVAGAIGTVARWGTNELVKSIVGDDFPWGILAINAIGCFLFGLMWILAEKSLIHDEARLVGLVGFLGAYTTFSTFAFDSAYQLSRGHFYPAVGNIILQNTLGLLAVFAGFSFGRRLADILAA